MALLTSAMTMDDIDDWFKAGQAAAASSKQVTAVAKSATGGREFDPVTGKVLTEEDQMRLMQERIPHFRRFVHIINIKNTYIHTLVALLLHPLLVVVYLNNPKGSKQVGISVPPLSHSFTCGLVDG